MYEQTYKELSTKQLQIILKRHKKSAETLRKDNKVRESQQHQTRVVMIEKILEEREG